MTTPATDTANENLKPSQGSLPPGPPAVLVSWPTWTLLFSLVLFYIGERAIGEPPKWRWALDGAGALVFLLGYLGRILRMGAAKEPNHRTAEKWLVHAGTVVLLGLGLYFVFAVFRDPLRESLGKGFERADGVVAVLWPMLVVLGGMALVSMQRSLLSMTNDKGEAEHVELQRVRYSVQSGATVALVLIFCFAVNYIASEHNGKYDMARFRSTRPSPATRKVVENLNKQMKATLFFGSPNEVREQVEPYFADLARVSPRFTYEVADHALEPQKARELSATGNGMVVLYQVDDKGKPGQKETLHVETTLERAGSALGTLDGDVQKRLLLLTRPGRIAYFTVGHGERGFERNNVSDMQKDDLRAAVGDLRSLLQSQAYDVRTLGVGQGLATRVPGDAGIVFVAGASEKFLPEEVEALLKYLNDGGHVYLLLDPAAEATAQSLEPLLKATGLKYHPQLLCNDEVYAVRTHKPADHANVASISFSSHASVSTLSRASGRAAVILPRTGWLERESPPPAGMVIDFTVRSMPKTYADLNGNFAYDKEEKQQVYDVAAAVSKQVGEVKDKKELRLAVLGSVDAVADLVLANRANLFLALDTVKWLMGDDAIAAETAQETDLPIVHTKNEDKVWFYSTIFAAPVLLLFGGLTYARRARRRRA